jgi:cell division protein FtsX
LGILKSFSFSYTPYYWLTVTSLAVLLFFAGLFISSFWFSDRWEDLFKENIEFLVECNPNQSEADLQAIQKSIGQLEGIKDIRLISASEAMKLMRRRVRRGSPSGFPGKSL